MATLEMIKVNKIYTYKGAYETQVLFDIDISFEANTCTALIGESGSGKSTLLNIIGTLDTPTSGQVVIDGRPTVGLSKNQLADLRNTTIGFIFQFHYLLPEFTVMENVLIPHQIHSGRATQDIRKRAQDILDMVGILRLQNKRPTQISGGEQQRTAIARALINNPKIILADEPTGNLDSVTTGKICSLFGEIKRQFQTTFIVVTHDRSVAAHTDRIIEIKDGRIISDKANTAAQSA